MVDITVGIDIGGTNTKLGFVDREGKCLVQASVPTNAQEPAETLIIRLHNKIDELQAQIREAATVKGIGIGAPNGNYYRGTVENPPNLSWKGKTDIVGLFHRVRNIPVTITNDANAAALGEGLFGVARGMKDFIVITLGTGLGSGIVANGELIYGADGFAGELGHTIVDPDGRECGCGRKGCLETYASGPAIAAMGIKAVVQGLTTRIGELANYDLNRITPELIYQAARGGDAIAQDIYERAGFYIGIAVSNVLTMVGPRKVVIGGGVAQAGEMLLEPIRRTVNERVFIMLASEAEIVLAELGTNAGIIGAAMWAYERITNQEYKEVRIE